MTDQIASLYHLPTLIGTLHFIKMTTITVSKVIVDVIQFILPLTTFLLVSTVHLKCFNFSVKCPVRNCLKLRLFFAAHGTGIRYPFNLPLSIQTGFTKAMTTTQSHIRISTGKRTYLTTQPIRWCLHKVIFVVPTILLCGRGSSSHNRWRVWVTINQRHQLEFSNTALYFNKIPNSVTCYYGRSVC